MKKKTAEQSTSQLLSSPAASSSLPVTNRKKRKALVLFDDDDEDVKNELCTVSSSTKITAKPDVKKLRRVEVADMFGNEPAVKPTNETIVTELDVSILEDLNASIFEEEAATGQPPSPANKRQRPPEKVVPQISPRELDIDLKVLIEKESHFKDEKKSIETKSPAKEHEPKVVATPSLSSSFKRKQISKSSNETDSVETDEDRQEKRRNVAISYQHFKNRGGPVHPGSKEIPKVNINIYI